MLKRSEEEKQALGKSSDWSKNPSNQRKIHRKGNERINAAGVPKIDRFNTLKFKFFEVLRYTVHNSPRKLSWCISMKKDIGPI